ncbi:MAG: site-specific integrase [Gemmataceae bacterium]
MARPKNALPTYKRNKNEARCWVGGRWLSLGPWDSPQSRAEFARVCAELAAGTSAAVAARSATTGRTVAEIIVAFKEHAERYYVGPDGVPTGEAAEYGPALKIVRQLYGHTPAREFGPVALKAVREAMVGKGWCRTGVNRQVNRVRRCFKWAASEELIPGAVVANLSTLAGLRKHRTTARETDPVMPVPEADYLAALPFMVPTVRAMVQLQRLAGLRPGEVRNLTPEDLNTAGELWVYAPSKHKMAWMGREKAIPLPPSARAIIEPRLVGLKPDELVFTPAAARAERYAALRAARKSKVQPSQVRRGEDRSRKALKVPGRFTKEGYGSAISNACKRAGVRPWAPGRLRHNFGSEVRDRFGLDVAQVLLGHAHADVTQVYAQKTLVKAMEAARALG